MKIKRKDKNLIFLIVTDLIKFLVDKTKINNISEYIKESPNLYNGNFKNHRMQQIAVNKNIEKRL